MTIRYKNRDSFNAMAIGQEFVYNNTRYKKKSSRTATHIEIGQWFYFRTGDLCYFNEKITNGEK